MKALACFDPICEWHWLVSYCHFQMVLQGTNSCVLTFLNRLSRLVGQQTDTATHQISVCQIYVNAPPKPLPVIDIKIYSAGALL